MDRDYILSMLNYFMEGINFEASTILRFFFDNHVYVRVRLQAYMYEKLSL